MCSEHALSLIQSLVAKRQRSCVAQSVERSPGLREVRGSNPGTADQCFSAIPFLFTKIDPHVVVLHFNKSIINCTDE